MKRPRGDMSEKTGRVVDIEFIQEPKTQALLGRVKTDRAREFFFKGGHVRAEFKGGVVLDNDGLSEAIGLAVDADLVVAVESDDGNRGVVIRNSKGALVVHPVLRQAFRSQSPELISAMDALIESKPKMEIDAPDCARPDGMVSGFDNKVAALTVAFKEGGQYFMRVVALVLREVLAEYPDGFPRRKEPPDRSIPLIAAGRTEDGERYIETEHPAFSEHGTIRAALLLAELKLAEEGEKLFRLHPEVFDPSKISSMSSGTLTGLLKAGGVTRFPGQDVKAWRTIAKNLHSGDDSPIRRLIDSGVGDAVELLEDLRSKDKKGNTRFPQFRGRKIGPMWISIMADPCQGGARIDRIDAVPVAVDVHVRRVTEYLGLASTRGLSTAKATPIIQKVWRDAVETADICGPPGIRGTCAALDQALWSFGRESCNHCNIQNHGYPLHDDVCDHCVEFPKD